MELSTEVEGANEMKSEMEVPAEWICEESSNWEEIPVTSRKWMICLMEEVTGMISTMDVSD